MTAAKPVIITSVPQKYPFFEASKRLKDAARPRWLRIGGFWYPRGGIPIDVFFQTGAPPPGLWLPDPGVPPYRGRG
jgi:7-cyano-7-deazaguanine reductase